MIKTIKYNRLIPILILTCLTIFCLMALETREEQHLKNLRDINIDSVDQIFIYHQGRYTGLKDQILITDPTYIRSILSAFRNVTYKGTENNFSFFMRDDNDSYYQIMFLDFNIVLTESNLHRSLDHPDPEKNTWICLGNTDEALRCVIEAFMASDEVW